MAFKSSTVQQPKLAKKQVPGSADGGKSSMPFKDLPVARRMQVLGGTLLASIVLIVIAAYFDNRVASHGTRYVAESSRLQMLSQRMAKAAERSLTGDYLAFEELTQSREAVISVLALLDKGDSTLPATSGKPRAALDELMQLATKPLANILAV